MGRDAVAVIGLLAGFPWLEDEGLATYSAAAALAREGRCRGITIGTVHAVLASLCLAHDALLFTLDRDFQRIGFSGLRLYSFTSNTG